MLRSSWYLHDIVAPTIYRCVEVFILSPSTLRPAPREQWPFRCLSVISSTTQYAGTSQRNRCYPYYIMTFAFVSCNVTANLCALPLLAEILRFANRLHHLRIDIDQSSEALLFDIFSRRNLIRAPTASITSCPTELEPVTYAFLPSLQSLRSCRLDVVEALMRYRGLRTCIIDCAPSMKSCDAFLSITSPIRSSCLERLSFWMLSDADFDYTLEAIAVTFPSLQHLALRVNPWMVADVLKVRISFYVWLWHDTEV